MIHYDELLAFEQDSEQNGLYEEDHEQLKDHLK